ncbi:MAG TPA: hypothetical protein VLJ39_03805, partial [Tepidisphaeraceae bacterium]|nr:hypothetical protein [Tepidisphaeraceae bacterium]
MVGTPAETKHRQTRGGLDRVAPYQNRDEFHGEKANLGEDFHDKPHCLCIDRLAGAVLPRFGRLASIMDG